MPLTADTVIGSVSISDGDAFELFAENVVRNLCRATFGNMKEGKLIIACKPYIVSAPAIAP